MVCVDFAIPHSTYPESEDFGAGENLRNPARELKSINSRGNTHAILEYLQNTRTRDSANRGGNGNHGQINRRRKAGWLLATEGCLPSALGARVRRSNGKLAVTDGPFTEAKELVGGFAILKANSKEEAIELARQFLRVAGDGECELRQLYEMNSEQPDQASCHQPDMVAATR